jgi:fido (protein-threonine AMPylation protein)
MSDYRELKALKLANAYQGALASSRINQSLCNDRITNFSLSLLQDLHAKIFKDFPHAWLNIKAANFFIDLPDYFLNFTPGKFREPSEIYNPWMKLRRYDDTDIYTFYSCANSTDCLIVDNYLKKMDLGRLKKQPVKEKITQIFDIYKQLDFLHPFEDGNSRTNRLFISHLCNAIGLRIDWSKVSQIDLYAARDLNLLLKSREYYKGQHECEVQIEVGLNYLAKRKSYDIENLFLKNSGIIEYPLYDNKFDNSLEVDQTVNDFDF